MFISIDEFIELFGECDLYSEHFTERDATISYALSMMTVVDEVNDLKFMKMVFLEFLEALARCSDILSLPPIKFKDDEWTAERRIEQSLSKKIENMLYRLLNICKKEFKESYRFPLKDDHTGLFVVPQAFYKYGKYVIRSLRVNITKL